MTLVRLSCSLIDLHMVSHGLLDLWNIAARADDIVALCVRQIRKCLVLIQCISKQLCLVPVNAVFAIPIDAPSASGRNHVSHRVIETLSWTHLNIIPPTLTALFLQAAHLCCGQFQLNWDAVATFSYPGHPTRQSR